MAAITVSMLALLCPIVALIICFSPVGEVLERRLQPKAAKCREEVRAECPREPPGHVDAIKTEPHADCDEVEKQAAASEWTLWYRKARKGDAEALYNLGLLYRDGKSVAQDHAEAMRWFQKAASQGSAVARYAIGRLYHLGLGVTQNYPEAAHWYRIAAEQGEADAQDHLGQLYAWGLGVPRDDVEAMSWPLEPILA
jgi:TPR repeat protein